MGSRDLEFELKQLIVSALNLEDIAPQDIDSEEPLFGDGLGLDSIDGLELGMAIRKTYGITLDSKKEEVRKIFFNVKSIAAFVASRKGASP
ncbi:MAG TPA: phosphopantetheine-binding protein [Stellaceae bacterium]|jgi:acyl carrier protein|nr:phosphopantetheine-binding protein [Stellaceae bacterium]